MIVVLWVLCGALVGSVATYFALRRDLSDQTDEYEEGLNKILTEIRAAPTLPLLCPHCGKDFRKS